MSESWFDLQLPPARLDQRRLQNQSIVSCYGSELTANRSSRQLLPTPESPIKTCSSEFRRVATRTEDRGVDITAYKRSEPHWTRYMRPLRTSRCEARKLAATGPRIRSQQCADMVHAFKCAHQLKQVIIVPLHRHFAKLALLSSRLWHRCQWSRCTASFLGALRKLPYHGCVSDTYKGVRVIGRIHCQMAVSHMESGESFGTDCRLAEFESGVALAESTEASDSDTEETPAADDPVNDTVSLVVDFFRQFAPDRVIRGDAARLLRQCKSDGDVAASIAGLEAEYSPAARGFISEGRNRVCFTSAFFDPLLALYDRTALPPVLNVRPLDNVHKAQLLLPGAVKHRARIGILHGSRAAVRDRLWRTGLGPAGAGAKGAGAGAAVAAQGEGDQATHAGSTAATAAAARPLAVGAGVAETGLSEPHLPAAPRALPLSGHAYALSTAAGRL